MKIFTTKKYYIPFSFILLSTSCMRVNTDPKQLFDQVKEEVHTLTNQDIYWESSLEGSIEKTSIKEILQKELTSEFVVQIALLNNPDLRAFYERLGIAQADFAQAGLLKNPLFTFSYRFSTKSKVTDLIDMGFFQNFIEILLIPLKKKMARAEIEATKASLTAKILDIIAETKIAFYTLQAVEQIWDLKKQILLSTELSYEAAQRLFEAGNIKELQMSMERSLYEQAKLEVASWEITVLEAREKLNVLMGLWGSQINWKMSYKLPEISSTKKDFKNIENESIKNSIDLKEAYNKLLASAAEFGIDTSKLIFPQFDLGVSSEREDGIWYVGPALNLALPLFDFGQANSAKAKAVIMEKWNQYTALAVEIRSKARSSRFTYQNAYRQSQYLEKVVVPLAEKITHSVLLQHNAMQLGIFALLTAKKSELEKKIQAIQKQKEYWISKTIIQTLLKGHVLGKGTFDRQNNE